MEILEKNGYVGVCFDIFECNVGNVFVICGLSLRKWCFIKFDEIFDWFKRGDNVICVEIKILFLFINLNFLVLDFFEFVK